MDTPCRSELAREEPEGAAFIQTVRVIVNAHREQSSVDRLLLQGVFGQTRCNAVNSMSIALIPTNGTAIPPSP
ncbi:hypothetical protein D3C87_1772370 [compost metagenome]